MDQEEVRNDATVTDGDGELQVVATEGDGDELKVMKKRGRLARADLGHKVFLGGLPHNSDGTSISAYFGAYGKVLDAWQEMRPILESSRSGEGRWVENDHGGREYMIPRGFGFVIFDGKEPADRIIELSIHHIDGYPAPASRRPAPSLLPPDETGCLHL